MKRVVGLNKEFVAGAQAKAKAASLPTIMKERGIPEWVRQFVREAAAEYGVPMISILTASRKADVCLARYAAIYRIKHTKRRLGAEQIGKWFGRDHATVFFALARHVEITGRPPLTSYSLQRRAASIAKSKLGKVK